MMSSTERRQILGRRLARWPTFVHGHIGVDVVVVAGAGVDRTPGEDAVPVAQDDQLAHPCRRVVLVDRVA